MEVLTNMTTDKIQKIRDSITYEFYHGMKYKDLYPLEKKRVEKVIKSLERKKICVPAKK